MAAKKKVRAKAKILPKVMSKLIEIALNDLKKAEATKGMVVDMAEWLNPNVKLECTTPNGEVVERRKACIVCAAGAVMAFTLGKKNTTKELFPEDMRNNEDQLCAINELRCGDVANAASYLGICEKYHNLINGLYSEEYEALLELNEDVPEYDNLNPKSFHKAMEKLATKLRRAGY